MTPTTPAPARRRLLFGALAAALLLLMGAWWVAHAAMAPSMPTPWRLEQLRPLGGQPPAPDSPAYLRIVAADAALASRAFSSAFAWGGRRELAVTVDRFADAAELLRADVLVVFDLPVAGDRLHEARPLAEIASHGELWWRLELDRVDRRFALWPPGGHAAWLGRGRVSTVVFSRYPLTLVGAARHPAMPNWPWDGAGNWEASLGLDCGPSCSIVLRVDEDARAPLAVGPHEVVVSRPGNVRAAGATTIPGDDGALAVVVGSAYVPRQRTTGGFFYDSSPRNSVTVDLTMPAPAP